MRKILLIGLIGLSIVLAGCASTPGSGSGGDGDGDREQPATDTGTWNEQRSILAGQEILYRAEGDCPRTTVTYTHGQQLRISSGAWGYSTAAQNIDKSAPWGTVDIGSKTDEDIRVSLNCDTGE